MQPEVNNSHPTSSSTRSPGYQYINKQSTGGPGGPKRKRDEKTCAHCGQGFKTREQQRAHAKVCKQNKKIPNFQEKNRCSEQTWDAFHF